MDGAIYAEVPGDWQLCPICGATRPQEKMVLTMAPALVKERGGKWEITRTIFLTRVEVDTFYSHNEGARVIWPAPPPDKDGFYEVPE